MLSTNRKHGRKHGGCKLFSKAEDLTQQRNLSYLNPDGQLPEAQTAESWLGCLLIEEK
jgi:hypothetical protein